MTDVVLVRYDIERGMADELRRWLEGLGDRSDEASSLLEAEGMLTESLFVRETDGGDELWWYQEAADMERVLDVYRDASSDLAEESRALLEAALVGGLEAPTAVLEPVVHAVGPARGGEVE